jgi:ABC-type uncharacterized transport system involved in gliding motility auxiliary subunit
MKLGSKALAILLLFAGLVLVNYLAALLPGRFDATAERIYTLSAGTKSLLGKIEEPLTLDLYFSRSTTGQYVEYKNYAERVQEMLRQYVRAGHGRIRLNLIDPEPDTPDEERATTAGIAPQTLPGGGAQFYFGLVATEADQQKTIAALSPQREQFLEYDISELIYGVQLTQKQKLGLITSLPLQGSPGMPMMGQPGQPGQYVATAWADTYDIQTIEATATELPPGLDALAIIHPENLSAKLQFAIDQFLLGGKPVFLAVDPSSQYFKRQGGQMAMMGGPPPNVSSDLPALLSGWGIAYNANQVIGDLGNAEQVQLQNGTLARYPVWINLTQENFNAKALPTAQLTSALFIEPGSVALKPGTNLTFTPLITTSPRTGEVPAESLQMAQPDDVARALVPSGSKTIAALITGRFRTAFPGGAPKDEPAAGAGKEDKPGEGPGAAAKAPGTAAVGAGAGKAGAAVLKKSKGTSTLLIVADTDWLFDDYSLRKFNFLGQSTAEPINDNLAFAANSLDFLAGSQDLISIRGKGNSLRPFTVVRAMEAQAEDKYREKLTGLEARLTEVQNKLGELQGKKTEGNRLIASPEVTKAIEDFQKQQNALRAERRSIRLALREGIDALENRLLLANLLATPLLVCGFGAWFYRQRRR